MIKESIINIGIMTLFTDVGRRIVSKNLSWALERLSHRMKIRVLYYDYYEILEYVKLIQNFIDTKNIEFVVVDNDSHAKDIIGKNGMLIDHASFYDIEDIFRPMRFQHLILSPLSSVDEDKNDISKTISIYSSTDAIVNYITWGMIC